MNENSSGNGLLDELERFAQANMIENFNDLLNGGKLSGNEAKIASLCSSMMEKIELKTSYLSTLNNVSSILHDLDADNFEENLSKAMMLLKETVDLDRICIWKNHTVDGKLYRTQIYEWFEEAISQPAGRLTKNVPYCDTIPTWEVPLSRGDCIVGLVRNMPHNEKRHLSSQGIISVMAVPVFFHEEFWGFIGFDYCFEEREFSENEGMFLRSAGNMVAHALIRENMTQITLKNQKESIAILENILNSISAMIYVSIPHTGEVLFMNDHMKHHFGIEGDVVGKICYKVMQKNMSQQCELCPCIQLENDPERIINWEESNSLTGRTYSNMDRYIIWPDGRLVHLQHSVDITELVVAKELAEQGSRTKSSFLAKMSHEIRTPMNAILGMTELALREDISDTVRDHVLAIKQAGSNLLTIINDVLDFSKIETGRFEIIDAEYSVESLLNDVVSIIRMRVLDSQIRFAVNVDCGIPGTLFGDETRIRQILMNVLGNAAKYTERGFISFTVTGEFVDEDTVSVTFEVTDSGRGIKPEDANRLFEDFTQFDLEKNRGIEGVGLGLAITHSIVKEMGGTIGVESEYGKGSTFTITIPQKYYSGEVLATVENPGGKSILLYERRDVYANSILKTISNLGANCTLVKTDSELCEKLSDYEYDFIFLSFALYVKSKDKILKSAVNPRIVVLTEFGDAVPDKNMDVLAMPVYCILVAKILNGVYGGFSYDISSENTARFSAPEAKILVVDDISTNLRVAQGLLAPYNVRVDVCKSGMEALKAVCSKEYDLVLMDHKMPEMDGVEAVRRIREMGDDDSYYSNLPIIALTANAIAGTREMFLENGFNDFLSKPIDTVILNSILEKWISEGKQERFLQEQGSSDGVSNIKIDGLDVDIGVSRSGGTVGLYLETLAAFYEDGTKRIEEIELCLEEGNLSLYTIYVHGLKGAAMVIGADELSEMAKDLEMAGKREDWAYISTRNAEFVSVLNTLLGNIDAELNAKMPVESAAYDAEALKQMLRAMRSAIDAFDAGAMNSTLESLLKLTQGADINADIKKISVSILMGEYDEAAVLADMLLS